MVVLSVAYPDPGPGSGAVSAHICNPIRNFLNATLRGINNTFSELITSSYM
jgi:hypothetical protein